MTSSENVMELGPLIMKMERFGVMGDIKMGFKKVKTRFIIQMVKSDMVENGKMTNKWVIGSFTMKVVL